MRVALKVYYDGRNFFGSQRQPDRRTAEGEFLKSLDRLNIKARDFVSACRTDRGVSALGNVFALTSNSKVIPSALNSVLPDDIRVLGARDVTEAFNPRYAALSKTYKYFLYDEGYSLPQMKKAAKPFIGEHSFHNFAKLEERDPVRKVKAVDVKKKGRFIIITTTGESFLYQMVRRMATALKMAGGGLIMPDEIERLLDDETDNTIYPLPAENLVLWSVEYPFTFEHDEYCVRRLKKDIQKRQVELRSQTAMNEMLLGEL